MLGKTHIPVGITTAILVTQPTTVSGVIGAVAGGAIGGWICDIDVRTSSEKEGAVAGFIFMVIDVAVALGIDFILGSGLCYYMISTFSVITLIALGLFIAGCIFGIATSHRTFMHSILALALFSVLMYFICRPLTIPFAVGFISHIVLDLFNKRGIQLFFPLKAEVKFEACDSDGQANRVIGGIAIMSSIVLIVIYGFMAFKNEPALSYILDILRTESPFIFGYFELYLIAINVITFIAYVIDFLVCYNGYVPEEKEDMLHDFLNIFAFIGGAAGALLALIILAHKGRENAYWFIKIISILLAWLVVYMVVRDPFGIIRYGPRPGILSHLPLIIYLLVINVLTGILFIRDRNKRRSNINSSEFLLILMSFIGGAAGGYLVMSVTNGKQNFPHFSVGLPVMMAIQTFVIAFLILCGIA